MSLKSQIIFKISHYFDNKKCFKRLHHCLKFYLPLSAISSAQHIKQFIFQGVRNKGQFGSLNNSVWMNEEIPATTHTHTTHTYIYVANGQSSQTCLNIDSEFTIWYFSEQFIEWIAQINNWKFSNFCFQAFNWKRYETLQLEQIFNGYFSKNQLTVVFNGICLPDKKGYILKGNS